MFFVEDYWKLKKAYAHLKQDNLASAFHLFVACKRTSKISFNLAVISLWQHRNPQLTIDFLLDALERDPFLSIAAFYLGVLTGEARYFDASSKGFRNCCEFIDYTAIGMPFLLTREDVLFNLVSLQPPTADPSYLQNLSIQSISSLLLSQLADSEGVTLRIPPMEDRKMIFDLLPAFEPESFELKGPEHVILVEGEDEYFSGFPDAHNRQIKLDFLKMEGDLLQEEIYEENENENIKINEISINTTA